MPLESKPNESNTNIQVVENNTNTNPIANSNIVDNPLTINSNLNSVNKNIISNPTNIGNN